MKRIAVLLFAIACAQSADEEARLRSAAAPSAPGSTPPASVSATATRKDDCPATGEWALCSFEKRLKRSGFVAKKIDGESPERPGFAVIPAVYTLGRGRLEVFLYDDSAAAQKDIAGLDTLAVAPVGTVSTWPSQPGLIRSGNLLAVYMDQSVRQAERLTLAITAGAPSSR